MSETTRPIGLREQIHDLYSRLHEIGQSHEEISDTEAQEILGWTLNHHFIYGPVTEPLPQCYGLFDRQANIEVGKAVARFLDVALPAAKLEGCMSASDRCNVLQERRFTRQGGAPYDYDVFVGHADKVPPDYPAPNVIDIFASPAYPGSLEPEPDAEPNTAFDCA